MEDPRLRDPEHGKREPEDHQPSPSFARQLGSAATQAEVRQM